MVTGSACDDGYSNRHAVLSDKGRDMNDRHVKSLCTLVDVMLSQSV